MDYKAIINDIENSQHLISMTPIEGLSKSDTLQE